MRVWNARSSRSENNPCDRHRWRLTLILSLCTASSKYAVLPPFQTSLLSQIGCKPHCPDRRNLGGNCLENHLVIGCWSATHLSNPQTNEPCNYRNGITLRLWPTHSFDHVRNLPTVVSRTESCRKVESVSPQPLSKKLQRNFEKEWKSDYELILVYRKQMWL